jgi:hypothetical protein
MNSYTLEEKINPSKQLNYENKNSIIDILQDYMFTAKNLIRYTKHIIQKPKLSKPKQKSINSFDNKYKKDKENPTLKKIPCEKIYKPKQKDSLFWCFYILKHGYSNYEMEINNQYFVIEKKEKFRYIEMLRNNKNILKIHKIKPFTELEDDLANKDKISIKTFFALCILENINVLLVDKRKIYEITCIDVDETHPINIVHRNSYTLEHHIELNVTNEMINNYRENYYKMSNFDSTLKAMASYKLDELIDLCKKLDIQLPSENNNIITNNSISNFYNNKKKFLKKDIYQLLVSNY